MFSVEDAYRLLADIEMKTTTKFPCFKADKSFGNIDKLVPERIFQKDYRDCEKITMSVCFGHVGRGRGTEGRQKK